MLYIWRVSWLFITNGLDGKVDDESGIAPSRRWFSRPILLLRELTVFVELPHDDLVVAEVEGIISHWDVVFVLAFDHLLESSLLILY